MTNIGEWDAIVIGAGVIGTNVGYELAKAGYRTLNIDKAQAAGSGSTSNSCAIVRCHYSTHPGVAMAYEGFQFWKRWEQYVGDVDEHGKAQFIQCGGVFIGNRERYFNKVLPLFNEMGIEYEVWDIQTLRSRLPGIDPGEYWPPKRPEDETFWEEPKTTVSCAVYTPVAGYVSDPQLATHNLQRAAEKRGAQFSFNAEVVDVISDESGVKGVQLRGGEVIRSAIVVNVAGPHSAQVNEMAGVYDTMGIKTRALRHEVHHVPAPEGVDWERDGYYVGDDDLGIYSRPEVGNHILVGSQDPDCDSPMWIENPDEFERKITSDQWHAQVFRLARRFPELGVPNLKKGVVDLYDVSDDWLPIYDKTDLPGFYVAIGSSGNQFKNCHVAAYCMSKLITAVESGYDHDEDPLVVELPYSGLALDLGAFSRNRPVNADSSFSVVG